VIFWITCFAPSPNFSVSSPPPPFYFELPDLRKDPYPKTSYVISPFPINPRIFPFSHVSSRQFLFPWGVVPGSFFLPFGSEPSFHFNFLCLCPSGLNKSNFPTLDISFSLARFLHILLCGNPDEIFFSYTSSPNYSIESQIPFRNILTFFPL